MGLKKFLWNDKATELFGHRRDQNERAAPERPEEDTTSHRSHTARKVLKGSAAFTSALLFGNGETQGLIRTLGAASGEAFKNISKRQEKGSSVSEGSVFEPINADTSDPRTSTVFGDYYDSLGRKID